MEFAAGFFIFNGKPISDFTGIACNSDTATISTAPCDTAESSEYLCLFEQCLAPGMQILQIEPAFPDQVCIYLLNPVGQQVDAESYNGAGGGEVLES